MCIGSDWVTASKRDHETTKDQGNDQSADMKSPGDTISVVLQPGFKTDAKTGWIFFEYVEDSAIAVCSFLLLISSAGCPSSSFPSFRSGLHPVFPIDLHFPMISPS